MPCGYFTIHQRSTHVPYTVQIHNRETEQYRTHAFVFKRKCDAIKMSRMLEAHFQKHEVWPCNDVSPDSAMRVDASNLREMYEKRSPLEHLYIRTWQEENLHAYISEYALHILQFDKFAHGDIQMQYTIFDYTDEYLRYRLQQNLRLD